jgi:type I restriction enzyme S subunit
MIETPSGRRPLRAVAEVALGRQRSPEHDQGPFMVKYLRAANVKDGVLDLSDVKAMNFSLRDQGVFSLQAGDVLITEGAGSLNAVGASAVWNGEIEGVVCFQNTLLRLRPRRGTSARFLAWWSRHAYGSGLLASLATGASIYHLSAEGVRSLPIWLPGGNAQEAVADFLDSETARVAALIEKKRRMVDLLRAREMGVIAAGVEGRYTASSLVSPALPWLRARGSHWQEAKLTLVSRLGSGHTPSRSKPEWWQSCTIPWITTGEVAQMRSDRIEFIAETREMISPLGVENSSAEVHPAGTVVLCRTASAGYSAIMATDMATSQDFVTWTCGPLLRPRFLLLCLRAMRADLLGRLAMGSTHLTIYMPDIEAIRVPLPPVEEQDRIVDEVWARLRPLHDAEDALERQIALLVEHRQALITAAVTGELDLGTAA